MKVKPYASGDDLLEELEMAREALFQSRTIKEVKFWQEKIAYLTSLINKGKLKYRKSK
ncbi:MAG: hypothetical protein ACO2OO_00010 [Candidatus Aenigmatarchaeota archaeon]|jgi:hypothetical protein